MAEDHGDPFLNFEGDFKRKDKFDEINEEFFF